MKLKPALAALAFAALLPFAAPAQAITAITLTTPGDHYPGSAYTLGFEFSVAANTSITSLGAYDRDQDGLNGAINVGLWDTAGTLLTSVVVPAGTGGSLVNMFRFAAITPYALTAGTHYIVGAYAADDFASSLNTNQGGSGSIDPSVTIYRDRFSDFNSIFSFPTDSENRINGAWLGANFQTSAVGGVPEPATWAMMLIGFAGLGYAARRRKEALAAG